MPHLLFHLRLCLNRLLIRESNSPLQPNIPRTCSSTSCSTSFVASSFAPRHRGRSRQCHRRLHIAPRLTPRVVARPDDRPSNPHHTVGQTITSRATPARTASQTLLNICRCVLVRHIERLWFIATRRDGARQCSRDEETEFAQRNAQPVYDDRADDQEPDDYVHDLYELCRVLPGVPVYLDLVEELDADVEVKRCADANGAEEADEECLSLLFDLVNLLVHTEHNGWAAEQQD